MPKIGIAAVTRAFCVMSMCVVFCGSGAIGEDKGHYVIKGGELPDAEKLARVESLSLDFRKIGISNLTVLRNLDRLRSLRVRGIGDRQNILQEISRIPHLKTLALLDVKRNTPLQHLVNLRQLEDLSLYSSSVTDDMMRVVTCMPSLKSITAGCGQWSATEEPTDRALVYLKEVPLLQSVSFCSVNITDEGLAHLSALDNLRSVELWAGRFTDSGLRFLSNIESLRRLIMPNNSAFTDVGLRHLANLRHLEELRLGGGEFTDEGFAALAGIRNLRDFQIGHPGRKVDLSPYKGRMNANR